MKPNWLKIEADRYVKEAYWVIEASELKGTDRTLPDGQPISSTPMTTHRDKEGEWIKTTCRSNGVLCVIYND